LETYWQHEGKPLPTQSLTSPTNTAQTFYNVYAICGFAAIGGALFGFDISSMSGVLGTRESHA
jgi:hypothetical protein